MLAALLFTALVYSKTAIVHLKPDSTSQLGLGIAGTVKMVQHGRDDRIKITLDVSGLAPNTQHGWHVHDLAVPASQNCTASGPHFNPMNKTHGAPGDTVRHFGDLGNFLTDGAGKARITVTDRLLSLFGAQPVNALDRGFVVHQNADDLGRGSAPLSLTTGNAGARLACGNIIEMADAEVAVYEFHRCATETATLTASPSSTVYESATAEATETLSVTPNTTQD
ncbi:Superoxide dismutase [Cu-Zn], partial [Boothiomyces sp. JEL0838]